MLGSVIREIIAPVLRECPPECGMVAITDVQVSPDCSYATVYVSALRSPDAALAYMESCRKDLQHRMSELKRRQIPLLRFRLDRTAERGERIDALLSGS